MIGNFDDVRFQHSSGSADALRRGRAARVLVVGVLSACYALDALSLYVLARAGTVHPSVPSIYGLAGLGHVLIFSLLHLAGVGERSRDPYLTVWQMAYAIAVQLMAMAIAPQVPAFFLALIVVTFGFGALTLPLRRAIAMWALACIATAAVLLGFRSDDLAMSNPTRAEALVFGAIFASILLRVLLLGYFATWMRLRLFREARDLARDNAERRRIASELEAQRRRLEDLVGERTLALSVAKEAAESANRAKSTFLANMSHELRTPMHGIMGYTALARRHASDPRQAEQLDRAEAASRRLLAIIDDILDLSRIEADRLCLDSSPFMLEPLLAHVEQSFAATAAEKGLAFSVDRPPALCALHLRGDSARLGQILLDLVDNAVKFTSRGSVQVGGEIVSCDADAVTLRFAVRDTGVGIAEGDRARLFQAFEQLDGSTTRRFGGAGLGLAIARRLVRMMGGKMGVDGAPGVGSSFWFTVRLARESGPAATPPGDAAAAETDPESLLALEHRGARVLVVDDDPACREVTAELLRGTGLVVDVASNGERAVELAAATAYDLVLMDMQMPAMDGLDATRAIRRLPGGEFVPVVALTANAFDAHRRLCAAAGMCDFIAKPVVAAELFGTVRRCLGALVATG